MLNKQELATVTNRLQVPLIISDILDGEGALTQDVHMGLHEIISDLQPDSALLCIALGAKKIASIYHEASPSMKIMYMECDRIIEDYAMLWLQNADNEDIDEHEVLDTLSHITEDLEAMAEFLDLNISFLRAKDETAAELCDILSIQAKAHGLIADEFFNVMNMVMDSAGEPAGVEPVIAANQTGPDNIIQFPRAKGK